MEVYVCTCSKVHLWSSLLFVVLATYWLNLMHVPHPASRAMQSPYDPLTSGPRYTIFCEAHLSPASCWLLA